MPVVGITESNDPRLACFRGLRDGVLRDHGGVPTSRGQPGGPPLFVAESEEVIRRAALLGYRLITVLCDRAAADRLVNVLDPKVDVLVAPAATISGVSGLGVHRGALALVERPAATTMATVMATARRVVMLEGVTNPVNVGLIARSATALGCDALILDEHSADPLYRRAVRASMGATLALTWVRVVAPSTAVSVVEELRSVGFCTVALTLTAEAQPERARRPSGHRSAAEEHSPNVTAGATTSSVLLADVTPAARTALVLGSEGTGLTAAVQQACSVRAHIPMQLSAGVDSLNVSAAAAIACYALFGT